MLSLLPPPFSLFLLLSMISYGMGYFFCQLGSTVQVAPPPNFFPIPSLLAAGAKKEEKNKNKTKQRKLIAMQTLLKNSQNTSVF